MWTFCESLVPCLASKHRKWGRCRVAITETFQCIEQYFVAIFFARFSQKKQMPISVYILFESLILCQLREAPRFPSKPMTQFFLLFLVKFWFIAREIESNFSSDLAVWSMYYRFIALLTKRRLNLTRWRILDSPETRVKSSKTILRRTPKVDLIKPKVVVESHFAKKYTLSLTLKLFRTQIKALPLSYSLHQCCYWIIPWSATISPWIVQS